MRIISQNGMIDVPYELTAIHATKNAIRMNMAGETGNGSILATYSTETKTVKAMEMLHKEYMLYCTAKSEDYWFAFNNPKVFQFPKDEEIEVEDE